MRTAATRILASVLAALVAVSCGTVRGSRPADIEARAFLPRAHRAVASPGLEELELRRAIEELLPSVKVEEARAELRRMVADPRFHGRRPGELRVALASWGSGPAALEEIGQEYRAWCAAVRRTDCHEGPLTASSVYEIAFDFAIGSQWDGFAGEVKSTIAPSTIRIVLLTGLVIFMATIAIPELVSKIPAAAATVVLTAYLGAQAVCDLIFGWIQMVRELDAATTFNEVRAAGQRYGQLVGAQTARILILLATAAIAQGGLIARLMKLPRATQASAALAAETGTSKPQAPSAGAPQQQLTVTFGRNANQIEHAFRHTDKLGLSRTAVQEAIQKHLHSVAETIPSGSPFNQVIEVGGKRIQYSAFRLPDGSINVGRIHGAP